MSETDVQGIRRPRQPRSEQTLERILGAGTALISERSYDALTISDIARRAEISVGGFYSRFRNKEALFEALQKQLAEETESRLANALATDWSGVSLLELLEAIVTGNVELYRKYRGVLIAVHVNARVLNDDGSREEREAYNARLVADLEKLLLRKRDEIGHAKARPAIRVAIACMSSMLRDAIVFEDHSLFPDSGDERGIARSVSNVMCAYLRGEAR